MASDKHLAKLKEGAESWNDWRRAEPAVRPDLRGLSLSLGEKQWGETNGGPIDLSRAQLGEANLRHATLMHANLSEASLVGANLSGARLQQADLRNANLTNARLDDADLENALLAGADFSGADLRSARNLKPEQLEAARGDPKTLLPSRFVTPRGWMNGGRRADPVAAAPAAAAAAKPKWTGTFIKAPVARDSADTVSAARAAAVPASAAIAPAAKVPAPVSPPVATGSKSVTAPAKTSWMANFAKPADPGHSPSVIAASKGSWISAFAKPGALAATASDFSHRRTSWAVALAKTAAAPAAAAVSAATAAAAASAAAAKASWTAGFLKSSSTDSKTRGPDAPTVSSDTVVTAKPADAKSANATAVVAKSANATIAEIKPAEANVVPAKAVETGTRAAKFSDALAGNAAKSTEPDLDTEHDPDSVRIDEGPDPRWIADLARSAGATPLEEAAKRVKEWSSARVRQLATFNPSRPVRKQLVKLSRAGKSRLASLKPLTAPAAKLDAVLDAESPSATDNALLSTLASSLEPVHSIRTRLAVGAAVIALLLVAGSARFMPWHNAAWTLKENVPLSAQEAAQDDETPQRVAVAEAKAPVAVEELKGQQRVEPLAKPSAEPTPVKTEVPLGTIKPIKVKESPPKPVEVKASVAPAAKTEDVPKPVQVKDSTAPAAIKPENLPIPERIREKGTQVALAAPDKTNGEPAKATDASDATTVAQARSDEMRQHGELSTDTNDPATPLVAPPKVAAPAPAAKTVAAPVPEKKPEAPAADANKLSFAGEGLNALQTAKKSPATVVEYLKDPTKTTAWIETFIKKFYLSSAALSEEEIRSIYSEPMDFFGEKNVDLDRVSKEKADYYSEWPKRHYKLVPGTIEVQWTSDSVAEVSFLYDFNVSAPQKPANKGRGRAVLTIDLTESPGRIIREDGEVVATD